MTHTSSPKMPFWICVQPKPRFLMWDVLLSQPGRPTGPAHDDDIAMR